MKKRIVLILLGGLMLPATSPAIDLKQSKFTQIVNNVEIISATDKSRHDAAVNDVFSMPDVLRTGPNSRAELAATDGTITRVGANTIFSFDPSSRTIDLQQGSLLFHSPHGKGGGTIRTGSATASVIGTTIIVTATPNGGFKLLDLEGQAEVRYLSGLKESLQPGQMTFVLPAGSASPIVVFRLDAETKGSALVSGFNTPLDSTSKINSEITQQLLQILNGAAADTGLIVGDNATPTTVQVVQSIINENNENAPAPPSPPPVPPVQFQTGGSIVGNDRVSTLAINLPLDPNQLVSGAFLLPPSLIPLFPFVDANAFTAANSESFLGNNIDIDTASIDLSSLPSASDFNIIATGDMRIWQSLTFNSPPTSVSLVAGGALSIAEGATVKADTSLLWLGAGSFNTLDTEDGSIEFANTLDDVTIMNCIGDLDLVSGSDLTLQDDSYLFAGGSLSLTVDGNFDLSGDSELNADGDVSVETEDGGTLTIGGRSGGIITAGGSIELLSGAGIEIYNGSSLTANGGDVTILGGGDVSVYDSTISANAGYVDIESADGALTLGVDDDVTINATGDVTLSGAESVDIEFTTVTAGGDVTISSDGTVGIYSESTSSTTIDAGGAVSITTLGTVEIDGDGTSRTTIDAGLNVTISGNTGVDIEDSDVTSGFRSESGGSLTLTADNGDIYVSDSSLTANGGELNAYASGNIDIESSDLNADYGVDVTADGCIKVHDSLDSSDLNMDDWYMEAGTRVTLTAEGNLNISDSEIYADDGKISIVSDGTSGGSISITDDTTIESFDGKVCITDEGTISLSSGDTSLTGFNMDVESSDISADSGNLTITDGGAEFFDTEGDISIDDESPNYNNISISGSTLFASDAMSIIDNGSFSISGNFVDITDSDLTLNKICITGSTLTADDGDLSIENNGELSISGGDTAFLSIDSSTISANNISISGSLTANDGGVSIVDNGIVSISSGSIGISDSSDLEVNNISIDGTLKADCGDVTITDNGSISITTDGSAAFVSDSMLSANNINIKNSTITACGGDVDINDYGQVLGAPDTSDEADVISVNSISISGSTLSALMKHGNGGIVNISANGAVAINSSTITADASVSIASEQVGAGAAIANQSSGVTISGGSITAGSATSPGSIIITANGAGGTTINGGASLNASYISVNSPDGILIDGTGGTFSGNQLNLTAADGNSDGGPTASVHNADLSAFTTVNMAAHTIDLQNVAFSGSSIVNLGCYYGGSADNNYGININNSVIPGMANLQNVSHGGTEITLTSQVGVGIGTTPGIFVHGN